MRKSRILFTLMAAFTLWVAVISCGFAALSSQSVVYAQGLASAHAKQPQPPKAPDLGRFTPTLTVPKGPPPTPWKPQTSTSIAPKAATESLQISPPASTRTPGEQKDLRTETSSTILNKDGSYTLQSSSVPIHYQDAQGVWQDIDTSVVSDASDNGFAFGNKANSWRIHFAKSSGGPHLVHGQINGSEYFENVSGAASVDAVVNGSRVVYPAIFPNVDAIYTIMHAHMEETFLLRSAAVPASFALTYHVPGASAQQDASGNIIVTDAKGVVVFIVSAPAMFESNAQGQQLPTGAGSSNVSMVLSGQGPDYTVTLTPDAPWLANPNRVFPVAIDPTYTYPSQADQHSSSTGGNVFGDTFDESGHPTWNFYTTNSERVGNCSALPNGATGYGTGTNNSFLKFDAGSPLASNARVTGATLSLWQTSAYAGATEIDVSEIKSPWSETSLDWNNQPTGSWLKGSATTKTTYNSLLQITVTDLLYDWWEDNQPNYGLELTFANGNAPCDLFASDDYGSNLPTLSVTYITDTTPPAAVVSINGGVSENGAIFTNSTSLSLSPSFQDYDSTTKWTSNWSTFTGLGVGVDTYGHPAPHYTPAGGGSEVVADTSSCGATDCPAGMVFTTPVATSSAPTFTAMFMSDGLGAFNFGVSSSSNSSNRWDLDAPAGGNAFTTIEYSLSSNPSTFNSGAVNIPFSANTWYYGQVAFPLPDVGEIYLWPVGQPRPTIPTVSWTGLSINNPELTFWKVGSDGAGTHSFTVSNVTISDDEQAQTGYGAWGIDYSNDNANWSCPAPASGTWCVGAGLTPGWTIPGGDGLKYVYIRAQDNADNVITDPTHIQFGTVNLDQTPPTASITSPTAGREARGAVIVTAQATDPTVNGVSSGMANLYLYVDGQQAGVPQNGPTPSFLWDTTGYAPGPHMLSLVAVDHVGNSFTSPGVTVDVANTGQAQYNTYATRALPDGTSAGANVADGDALVVHQDLLIPGRGPNLSVTRTYNGLAQINNLFGWGWTSELDEGLVANSDGSVTYRDPDGGLHIFLPNGSGGYLSSPGLWLTLAHNGDGTYTLTARDQSKTSFNGLGYITGDVDRNGNALTVSYSGTTPTTVTDAAGRTLIVTVSGGHITQIVDPGARTYTYAYDGSGNLTDYTNPAGTVTQYSYDGAHHLTKIIAGYVSGAAADSETNVSTTLTYDSEGRLAQLLDPMNFDANFDYGATGSLQTEVYQLQTGPTNTLPATTDSEYELMTYTLPSDGSGAVTTIADHVGGKDQYQYDSAEEVTQATNPDGNVTTYTYDANGNELSEVVDPSGLALKTSWAYDSGDNLLKETDPANIVTQYTYDSPATGNALSVVKHYVSGGAQDSQTNVTTQYTYDGAGDALTMTDPTGIVTQYTYDPEGDVTQTVKNYVSGQPSTSDTNVTTKATYNALGEQTKSTDALGSVTQYTYNALGEVTQTIQNYQAGGGSDSETNVTTTNGYDAFGRQVTQRNARGFVTLTVYDADGRVTQTVQNSQPGQPGDVQTNVTTKTLYDAAGNATQVTDPNQNVTTTTYDADNRATEVVAKDSSGATVSDKTTSYDLAGQVTKTQTLDGATNPTTSYTYDAAGRQTVEADSPANPSAGATDPASAADVTTTSYDADGNATGQAVTNANASGDVTDTTMQYDALGRVTAKTADANTGSPQTTSYSYAANGVQTSVSAPAGNGTTTTQDTYDALGRLLSQILQAGTSSAQTTTYTYDAAGDALTSGDSAGTTSYSFDALGRLLTQTQDSSGGVTETSVANTYDNNGNLVQSATSYANSPSTVLRLSYDPLDRQVTLSDGNHRYSYDPNSNALTTQVIDPGSGASIVGQTATYDGGSRLLTQTDTVGASQTQLHTYAYTYSLAGDRASGSADGALTQYSYDASHQLLSETSGGDTISYHYDAYNNRDVMTSSLGKTQYTYDTTTHTELTLKTAPDGTSTAYTYDTSGNLLQQVVTPPGGGATQTTSYSYDGANRLRGLAEPDGTSIAYTYNASGQRTSVTTTPAGSGGGSATTINDAYQLGQLAYQTNGAGTLLASYTYDASGVPESVQVGSDPATALRYYYVYDARGDVVNLTDGSGAVVASYAYDTWGALTSSTENIPNANGWVNPYRYDGRDGVRSDAATGLDWMTTRAYDPSLGRFISRDPLGRAPLFFSDADNPYVYAGNNPLSNVDPSGQYRVAGQGATHAPSEPFLYHPPTHVVTVTPGNSPPTGRDAHGKCTLESTCDQDKAATFSKLKGEMTSDYDFGGGFALVGLLLQMYANKSDLLSELIDMITFVQTYVAFAPGISAFIFGETSSITHAIVQSAQTLGQTLIVLQGIRASVNALLAIGMFASLIPGIMDAFGIITTAITGPLGILQEALSVAAAAIAYGAQAASSWYLAQAAGLQGQLNTLGGMTTQQWCSETPGACGYVANWNA